MTDGRLTSITQGLKEAATRVWNRDDLRFIAHCVLLLGMLVWIRPMFLASIPRSAYEQSSIFWALLQDDFNLLIRGARATRPTIPHLLFLLVPTALLLWGRGRMTWEQWEHGKALRGLVMGLLAILAWSGSTFEHNMYLDQLHLLDRVLLIALALLSWRTPLAVPFAVRWVWIMLYEPYQPIGLDNFEFRSLVEVLVVFSVFVWASFIRSYRAAHFLLVGLGCWASYYYAAGVAKVYYGPSWSWLFDDRLSNLAFTTYMRGWLSFIPEATYLSINEFLRHFDPLLTWFTLIFELGAVACYFLNRRLAQLWLVLGIVFQFGIFALTGICFWKWMLANLAFLLFVSRGGAPVYKEMTRHWLVIAFGILIVFFSRERTYFYPQTGVAWYDTRMLEDYTLQAIGESGESYLVASRFLMPMDLHFSQGSLCYATNERSATQVYGVTGSHRTMMALENMKEAEDALRIANRGRRCKDDRGRARFDDFFQKYFRSVNRHGGRPVGWLAWLGRPRHLWLFPKGNLYDFQEPVKQIELWREVVVKFQGKAHRFDKRRVHVVDIPEGNLNAD